MNKIIGIIFTLFLTIFLASPVVAEGDRIAENLKCEVNIYQAYRNSSLPYAYNGALLPSGTNTNFDEYYVYSLNVRNTLAVPGLTTITSIHTTNISGTKEPIEILDTRMYPPGSTCTKSPATNTISCTSNFQFRNSSNGFVQMLLKVKSFSSDLYNTSTLFTINTDQGKVECAPMLMLNSGLPINTDSPISWKTKFAEISARHFTIMIGNNKFFLGKEPVSVRSDGYDDGSDNTYTTLESTWYEDGYGYDSNSLHEPVEMRMYMYFKRTGSDWKLTELRTYDGNKQGDWLYYVLRGGGDVAGIVGESFKQNLVFSEINGNDSQIICNDCKINAFMDLATVKNQKYSITSSSSPIITITNEPDTWFNIKVGLQSSTPYVADEIVYNWGYSTDLPFKIEYLDEKKSSVKINATAPGKVKLYVTAFQHKGGDTKQLATLEYAVNVLNYTKVSTQCTFINQPIFKNTKDTCCAGLSLVTSSDQKADIIGYCVDKGSSSQEFDRLEKELDMIKDRVTKSEVKQNAIQKLLIDFQVSLRRILKFLRLS